jgi:hypothetical protein
MDTFEIFVVSITIFDIWLIVGEEIAMSLILFVALCV